MNVYYLQVTVDYFQLLHTVTATSPVRVSPTSVSLPFSLPYLPHCYATVMCGQFALRCGCRPLSRLLPHPTIPSSRHLLSHCATTFNLLQRTIHASCMYVSTNIIITVIHKMPTFMHTPRISFPITHLAQISTFLHLDRFYVI